MKELLRTNNPVIISFTEALLRDAEIQYLVLDQNMSIIEGSLGILPQRILVEIHAFEQARQLLNDADITV